ncbi:hypothetical protein IWZ03DRAFT_17216 [Phyllosticta citriasiana]|uniref:Uncharacterized protein n=1 Tax=Phyllosticta citriasiana TaxID=595635 RepID=A0ABR1KYY4_9PEZI
MLPTPSSRSPQTTALNPHQTSSVHASPCLASFRPALQGERAARPDGFSLWTNPSFKQTGCSACSGLTQEPGAAAVQTPTQVPSWTELVPGRIRMGGWRRRGKREGKPGTGKWERRRAHLDSIRSPPGIHSSVPDGCWEGTVAGMAGRRDGVVVVDDGEQLTTGAGVCVVYCGVHAMPCHTMASARALWCSEQSVGASASASALPCPRPGPGGGGGASNHACMSWW